MAFALVGTSASAVGWSRSGTVSLPAGIANNNIVIVVFNVPNPAGTSCTPPTGYTLIEAADAFSGVMIYYHIWQTGDPTSVTFTFSDTPENAWAAIAYSGNATSSPIDKFSATSSSSGTTFTAPSVTTTAAGDMLLMIYGNYRGTYSAQSEGTIEVTGGDWSASYDIAIVDYQLGAAGATGDQTIGFSANVAWQGCQVAIFAAAATTTPESVLMSATATHLTASAVLRRSQNMAVNAEVLTPAPRFRSASGMTISAKALSPSARLTSRNAAAVTATVVTPNLRIRPPSAVIAALSPVLTTAPRFKNAKLIAVSAAALSIASRLASYRLWSISADTWTPSPRLTNRYLWQIGADAFGPQSRFAAGVSWTALGRALTPAPRLAAKQAVSLSAQAFGQKESLRSTRSFAISADALLSVPRVQLPALMEISADAFNVLPFQGMKASLSAEFPVDAQALLQAPVFAEEIAWSVSTSGTYSGWDPTTDVDTLVDLDTLEYSGSNASLLVAADFAAATLSAIAHQALGLSPRFVEYVQASISSDKVLAGLRIRPAPPSFTASLPVFLPHSLARAVIQFAATLPKVVAGLRVRPGSLTFAASLPVFLARPSEGAAAQFTATLPVLLVGAVHSGHLNASALLALIAPLMVPSFTAHVIEHPTWQITADSLNPGIRVVSKTNMAVSAEAVHVASRFVLGNQLSVQALADTFVGRLTPRDIISISAQALSLSEHITTRPTAAFVATSTPFISKSRLSRAILEAIASQAFNGIETFRRVPTVLITLSADAFGPGITVKLRSTLLAENTRFIATETRVQRISEVFNLDAVEMSIREYLALQLDLSIDELDWSIAGNAFLYIPSSDLPRVIFLATLDPTIIFPATLDPTIIFDMTLG